MQWWFCHKNNKKTKLYILCHLIFLRPINILLGSLQAYIRKWDYYPHYIKQIQDFFLLELEEIPSLSRQHLQENPKKLSISVRRDNIFGGLSKTLMNDIKRV